MIIFLVSLSLSALYDLSLNFRVCGVVNIDDSLISKEKVPVEVFCDSIMISRNEAQGMVVTGIV